MQQDPSYYDILGVDKHASEAALREAYRQQVLRNHPDHGGNKAVFDLITNAFETLVNPSARTRYDDTLDATPPGGVRIPPRAFAADSAEEAGQYYETDPTQAYSAQDIYNDAPDPYSSPDAWDAGAPWDEPTRSSRAATAGADTASSEPRYEPVREPAPRYVTESHPDGDVGRTGPLGNVRKVVLVSLGVWIAIALLTPLTIIPGLSDAQSLVLIFWVVLTWWMLSFSLRIAGWGLGLFAIFMAVFAQANGADTIIRLAFAFVLWLAGQWLFTWRKQRWRSFVAHQVLGRLPVQLRPDRRSLEGAY